MNRIHVEFVVDMKRNIRTIARGRARLEQRRIRRLRDAGLSPVADVLEKVYYFRHGLTPAEHAYRLMVDDRLASDRWRPQP